MKQWEIIADNLKKVGWRLGWVSALDLEGRTIWIVDAHGYGKRSIVRAEEILTAFLEEERAICIHPVTCSEALFATVTGEITHYLSEEAATSIGIFAELGQELGLAGGS